MIALVDGDTIAYRCAASCEPTRIKPERESFEQAIWRADELSYRVLSDVQAQEYRIFLSGSDNFRYLLYPEYKANRARLPRPEYLDGVRDFLLREWKAEVTTGYEADDGIAIAATKDTIICANDKDFRQIPGQHYNFVRSEFTVVDEDEACLNFWLSMLIGDNADNIAGVRGVGPKRARQYLEGLSPEEMQRAVRHHYDDDERFVLTYRLLRLLRSEEEYVDLLCEIQGTSPPEDSEGFDPEMLHELDS